MDKLYYFKKQFTEKRRKLTDKEVEDIWNKDIYKIKQNEDGSWDTKHASDVYHMLDRARYYSVQKGNEKKKYLYEYWDETNLKDSKYKTADDYFRHIVNQKMRNMEPSERFQSYDTSKAAYEQSNDVINNMIIDFIQSRLYDPKTELIRLTPGGFDNSKVSSRVIKQIINTDKSLSEILENAAQEDLDDIDNPDEIFDAANPLTSAEFHVRNAIAGKTIGIMANHSTNMVYCQALSRMNLKDESRLRFKIIQGTDSNKTQFLEFKDLIHNEKGKLYIAELLAASVDAVKDPVLNFLGINTYTANNAAFMARLGIPTLYIGLFLNQPILQELIEYMAKNNIRNINSGIKRFWVNKNFEGAYDIKLNEFDVSMVDKIIDPNYLFKTIREASKAKKEGRVYNTTNNKTDAMNTLLYFSYISKSAQVLSDFIQKTKFTAANSVENSLGGMMANVLSNRLSNSKAESIAEVIDFDFSSDNAAFSEEANKQSSYVLFDPTVGVEHIRSWRGEVGSNKKATYAQQAASYSYWQKLGANPFAFEQLAYDAQFMFLKALNRFFGYLNPNYSAIYHKLYDYSFTSKISKDVIDAANYAYPLYRLQHISLNGDNYFNGDELFPIDDNGRQRTNYQYYTKDFVVELQDILVQREYIKNLYERGNIVESLKLYKELQNKYDMLKDLILIDFVNNTLLDYVEPIIDLTDNIAEKEEDENETNFIYNNSTIELRFKDNIQFNKEGKIDFTASWEKLFNVRNLREEELIRPFANIGSRLIMYNFFKNGFSMDSTTFGSLVSRKMLEHLAITALPASNKPISYYAEYRQRVSNNYKPVDMNEIIEFIPLFYANNSGNYNLVKNISSSDIKIILEDIESKGSFNMNSMKVFPNLSIKRVKGGKLELTFQINGNSDTALREFNELFLPAVKNDDTRYLAPAIRMIDNSGQHHLFMLSNFIDADGTVIRQDNAFNINDRIVKYVEVPIRNGSDYSPLNTSNIYHFTDKSHSKEFLSEVHYQRSETGEIINRAEAEEQVKQVMEDLNLCPI